ERADQATANTPTTATFDNLTAGYLTEYEFARTSDALASHICARSSAARPPPRSLPFRGSAPHSEASTRGCFALRGSIFPELHRATLATGHHVHPGLSTLPAAPG